MGLAPVLPGYKVTMYERLIFCVGMKTYCSLLFDGFAEGTACCYKGFSRLHTSLVSLARDPITQGQ